MRKRHLKKLTLNRETVCHLSPEYLETIKAAGQIVAWSQPPQCDPACTSKTVSCTL